MRYEDVRWGIDRCSTESCPNDAEVLVDDDFLLCVHCTDRYIERKQIVGEFGREALERLPDFADWREKVEPFRRWGRNERGELEEITDSAQGKKGL